MPEIIIKYKDAKALKALKDLAKAFDIDIIDPARRNSASIPKDYTALPIEFAKNPDIKALAGIWEGRDITLEQLRKESWG